MMNVKSLDPQLLKNLPALLQQLQMAEAARRSRRSELIERARASQETFENAERSILSKAQPIEDRIAKVRTELQELEQKLAPLADARISAAFSHKEAIRSIRAELRKDAFEDVNAFQFSLESLRREIQNNWRNEDFSALKNFRPAQPMQSRIAAAMALTLDASKKAERIAVESDDVVVALRELRDNLVAEGIALNP